MIEENPTVCPMSRAAFQFQIGQIVTHRAFDLTGDRRAGAPQRLLIIERTATECPGGVQRHYNVRAVTVGYTQGFAVPTLTMNEIELTSLPAPEVTP